MKKPLACFAVLCELCANVSLSRADSYCAKLAKKLGFGVVSKESRPYMFIKVFTPA
jgi:hypothetical protein